MYCILLMLLVTLVVFPHSLYSKYTRWILIDWIIQFYLRLLHRDAFDWAEHIDYGYWDFEQLLIDHAARAITKMNTAEIWRILIDIIIVTAQVPYRVIALTPRKVMYHAKSYYRRQVWRLSNLVPS